jgi:hypothetical protein
MSNAKVIELNGKRYDAMTGRFLGVVEHSQSQPKPADGAAKHPARAPAPDEPRRRAAAWQPLAVHQSGQSQTEQATTIIVRRGVHHHHPPHQPQHTKTLMRHAVSPPALSLKRSVKVQPLASPAKQPQFDITPKQFVASVDAARLKRAAHVAQSGLVRHFDMTTQPQPARPAGRAVLAADHHIAVSNQPAGRPAQDRVPAAAKQRSDEIFERALAHANSHKQPPVTAKHAAAQAPRQHGLLSVAASTLAILLIVGFIAYQNANAIQIRLASSRAGINATLPAWRPDGFRVGGFSYRQGSVTISFHDSQAARSFSVTQAASSWDSEALLSDYVAPNNENYQAFQTNGSTIYTYGQNNASWVNSGIWYRLTTDGSLSTSQVVKLAASM